MTVTSSEEEQLAETTGRGRGRGRGRGGRGRGRGGPREDGDNRYNRDESRGGSRGGRFNRDDDSRPPRMQVIEKLRFNVQT